jgi:hypothetical protein
MRAWLRRWGWTVAKALLALAILAGIGRQFYHNLTQLDLAELTLRPAWLALSAALYLVALGASAWFWYRLLRTFGERPAWLATVRAYYIGHLGKYVPGKAWALLLRGNLVRGPGVRLGVAILSAFYEVLTTMASGALLAAVLFALQTPAGTRLGLHPVVVGVLLLVLLGVPLLPGVFNRLVARLAARFQKVESFRLPRLRGGTLALGLAVTACGWLALGASLWAAVQAVVPEPYPLTPEAWARATAMVGLSYVAGFLAFMLPSGVGVREGVLEGFLAPELAGRVAHGPAVATVTVLLLRLLWTSAELLMAAVVYWLPGPRRAAPAEGAESTPAGATPAPTVGPPPPAS